VPTLYAVEYARTTCNERESVLPLKNTNTTRNWHLLLPWLHALNIENQNHAIAHENEVDPIKQAKMFTLAPLCSFNAAHISIDNDILYGLLKRSKAEGFNFKSLTQFRKSEKVDDWWRKVFDLSKLKKEAKDGKEVKKFMNFITTDGVSVSFTFSLPGSKKDDLEDPDEVADMDNNMVTRTKKRQYKTPLEKWSPFEQFPEIDKLNDADTEKFLKLLEDFLIIGVDPGRRDIVTANYVNPSSPSTPKENSINAAKSFQGPARKRKKKNTTGRSNKGKGRGKHRHGGKRKKRRHKHGEVSFSVSMAQWRNDSGSMRAQKQAESWMKNHQVRRETRG
jgi:hypothetical protein